MPRSLSAPFFSANPVFRREEYADAVGRHPHDKVVTAMLTQHLHAGNIRRIARGVYASVPKHADARDWVVDHFLAASRLRRGGVIAYHSALALAGCAYTDAHEVQIIAPGEPRELNTDHFVCRFVTPPRGFAPPDGVRTVDRLGLMVSVTTIERTIADLFDRHDLAGGPEELFNSLDLVARVDAAAIVRYARTLGSASAAGAMGYWLEREKTRLGVPDRAIEELRRLAPQKPRYPGHEAARRAHRQGMERHPAHRCRRTHVRGPARMTAPGPPSGHARDPILSERRVLKDGTALNSCIWAKHR